MRLAGVPPPSLARCAPTSIAARRAKERDHLAARPSPTPRARARSRASSSVTSDLGNGPERTRRRLAERVRELLALAYEARLDGGCRRIAKETWGISVPRLTPAWRDAVRFYLAVEKNRALLATVLRAAAVGRGSRARSR